MACDRSLCIPNSVHVVVINARVSSGKRKFRGRDILVFKSNRNRPFCTHHWLLHFAIEISTLRQICKYTKRRKAAGAGKGKKGRKPKQKKEEGEITFLNIQLPQIFIVNLVNCSRQVTQKHYWSLKNMLYSLKEGQRRQLVRKGEPGVGSLCLVVFRVC